MVLCFNVRQQDSKYFHKQPDSELTHNPAYFL